MKRNLFIKEFDKVFKAEIINNTIRKQAKYDHLKLTFSNKILFGKGSYSLGNDGRTILNKLSTLLSDKRLQLDIDKIQVEGHTDNLPINKENNNYPRNNWELSAARAISVIRYLSEELKLAVPARLFTLNGYGPNDPIDEKDPDSNRRIEIEIYFNTN